MLEHVVTYNFDAIINAFHREALAMLLPYDSHWDRCHCMHECTWLCYCPIIPTGTGATVCMNACMHVCTWLCCCPMIPPGLQQKKQDSTRANAAVQHPMDQACTCTPVCMNVWMCTQAFVVVLTVLCHHVVRVHPRRRSWWYSQYCVIMLSAAFYNQQRLQFNAVQHLLLNPKP